MGIREKMIFIGSPSEIASFTGRELVYSALPRAIGASVNTVRSGDVLVECHMIRLMKPFHDDSMKKCTVTHPKLYFTDTGLACYLMGIHNGGSRANASTEAVSLRPMR